MASTTESSALSSTLNSTGRFNVSQNMAAMAAKTGMVPGGLASAAVATREQDEKEGGVNKQLLAVLQSGKSGSAAPGGAGASNVDLKVELAGNAKHKRAVQHKFLMTCQQPPVTLKWYPQTASGVIEHVEILLDLRDEPSPETHQHRFECSASDDGEFVVPPHMSRPNQPLYIAVNMYSAGESGYDVLQYELEVLTGTWDNSGRPVDNCGRWVNDNGHAFMGIWREGKPHTGKGSWSMLMRGAGEATMAVMQGDWRGGNGTGTLTTGPDADQVGLDPSQTKDDKKPWEVDRDAPDEETDLEIFRYKGEWDENAMPKSGSGQWMSQTRHLFNGEWKEYHGTGTVKASKRAVRLLFPLPARHLLLRLSDASSALPRRRFPFGNLRIGRFCRRPQGQYAALACRFPSPLC